MGTAGIIGLGFVGKTLAKAFLQLNCLEWVCSVNNNLQIDDDRIKIYRELSELTTVPEIIFICKNETSISQTTSVLAGLQQLNFNNSIIVHTSATLHSDILMPLKTRGAIIGSAHPYQTFHSMNPEILQETTWLIECNGDSEKLNSLIRATGGRIVETRGNEVNRSLYHASAIIASNYLNTLAFFSSEAAKKAGIDSRDFLPGILRTTLNNILNSVINDKPIPLTGPIVRGDTDTVNRHIETLRMYPELLSYYFEMAQHTAIAAKTEGLIDTGTFDKIIAAINPKC
jgi:predicted short-subunit dehydrogenase-like oxidoreductase (DUF2520 family)